MFKNFTLALIRYPGGGREVCAAPLAGVSEGDTVETDFGFGRVEKTVDTLKDDPVYLLFAGAGTIHKVQGVVYLLKYEDNDNDLPVE